MMRIVLYGFFLILILTGCTPDRGQEAFIPFPDHTWDRFRILRFELPVEPDDRPFRVSCFIRYTGDFPYRAFDFNMTMVTPSGEERINEYRMKIEDPDGRTRIPGPEGVYESELVLKSELYLNKKGLLQIELENLIPRMKTHGLTGVGIRLIHSGQERSDQ